MDSSNKAVKIIRYLLFPLTFIYGSVVTLRNKCFDWGVLKQRSFDIPVIAVGNLSVGGTGKTPQIEYLVRLLKDRHKIAVLSRGYKRKSEGFICATDSTTVEELGDEPFQFFSKFKSIKVAVDANRVNGIEQLLKLEPNLDLVLLDDAYQHRKVKASFYVLLTSYGQLYTSDFILPTGNLRETREGAKRADVIIVTKCPQDLGEKEQLKIVKKIAPVSRQKVFFTSIAYDNVVKSLSEEIPLVLLASYEVILVTGIAKPKPLLTFLEKNEISFKHLDFPDHHNFTDNDIVNIKKTFSEINSTKKIFLTTEKDFTRLNGRLNDLYSIGIQTSFLKNASVFDKEIADHIK